MNNKKVSVDLELNIDAITASTPERHRWLRDLAITVDCWRPWPRLFLTLYMILAYRTATWFMSLPEPVASQSAFATGIISAGAVWFGLYLNKNTGEHKE